VDAVHSYLIKADKSYLNPFTVGGDKQIWLGLVDGHGAFTGASTGASTGA